MAVTGGVLPRCGGDPQLQCCILCHARGGELTLRPSDFERANSERGYSCCGAVGARRQAFPGAGDELYGEAHGYSLRGGAARRLRDVVCLAYAPAVLSTISSVRAEAVVGDHRGLLWSPARSRFECYDRLLEAYSPGSGGAGASQTRALPTCIVAAVRQAFPDPLD